MFYFVTYHINIYNCKFWTHGYVFNDKSDFLLGKLYQYLQFNFGALEDFRCRTMQGSINHSCIITIMFGRKEQRVFHGLSFAASLVVGLNVPIRSGTVQVFVYSLIIGSILGGGRRPSYRHIQISR